MSVTAALGASTHDLSIIDGNIVYVTGADEVKQRVLVTLLHHYNEYFLNTSGGVPWYELILGSKHVAQAESILRQIILSVPGVVSIVNFNSSLSNRAFSIVVTLEVETVVGTEITTVTLNQGN